MGIVAISAMQAAVAAEPMFFKKNLTADSPSYLYTFISGAIFFLINEIDLKSLRRHWY
jgi:hypothetical protein